MLEVSSRSWRSVRSVGCRGGSRQDRVGWLGLNLKESRSLMEIESSPRVESGSSERLKSCAVLSTGGCCCEKWDVVTLKCAMTLVVKGLVMANIDGSEKR